MAILQEPGKYVDSAKYFSWEQFFTELLIDRTKDSYKKYGKEHLEPFYLQKANMDKVIAFIESGS